MDIPKEINIELFNSIMINTDNEAENAFEMCKHCPNKQKHGLSCCENMPCEIDAGDLIEVSEENIRKLIKSGLVIIDSYWYDIGTEEPGPVYYLRMRAINDERIYEESWGGCCIALVDGVGCQIPFSHRPKYGRIGNCKSWEEGEVSGNRLSAISWLPYQDIIQKILDDRS